MIGIRSSSDAAKRLMDLVGAGAGLIVSFPAAIAIAAAIRITMGKPVVFRQVRPGRYGRPFVMYKFRTMRNAVDSSGNPLPDERRLTRLGAFLRRSSLDELPELLNVLKGEMSLVGPRPLLMDYIPLYTPEQARRHEVRPGVTGWAQINGRNALGWEERFSLDVWYVDNRSLLLDVKILIRTIRKVLISEGISHEGHATMERFRGSSR